MAVYRRNDAAMGRAVGAPLDELAGDDVFGPEPDAVADLEDPPGAPGRRHHPVALGHGRAMGFSQRTCTPASSAFTVISACRKVGRVIERASTDRLASRSPRSEWTPSPFRSIWSAAPSTFPFEGSPAAARTLGLASQMAVTLASGNALQQR